MQIVNDIQHILRQAQPSAVQNMRPFNLDYPISQTASAVLPISETLSRNLETTDLSIYQTLSVIFQTPDFQVFGSIVRSAENWETGKI
jgi:hypothetical protein